MKAEVLDKVKAVNAAAAQVEAGVGRVKETVVDGFEDGIKTAKRAIRQGRRAAEDFVDDAEYQVKKHPFSAVAISFGVGLGLGSVIGLLLARKAGK